MDGGLPNNCPEGDRPLTFTCFEEVYKVFQAIQLQVADFTDRNNNLSNIVL